MTRRMVEKSFDLRSRTNCFLPNGTAAVPQVAAKCLFRAALQGRSGSQRAPGD